MHGRAFASPFGLFCQGSVTHQEQRWNRREGGEVSACSLKFFTWDLKLKIERALTHFSKNHHSVRGSGEVSTELRDPPTWPQHNFLQDTWSLLPKGGFHMTKKKKKNRGDFRGGVTCPKLSFSSGWWCSLEIWFLKLFLPLTKLSSLELSIVRGYQWGLFISGESWWGQGGYSPISKSGKYVLEKTEGCCSPAWPGHRA